MKKTVIQCVTALLCVIAVSVTSVISIGKISTAKVDAAKAAAANSSTSGEPSADLSADPSVDPANPADPSADPSATDPSNPADPATDPSATNPSNSNTNTNTNTNTNSNSNNSSNSNASKVPSTAADIAAYYNAAVNKAVNSKAGFSKKRTTSLSNLQGGALLKMSIVVETVNDFLGVGTTEYKNTKGKVGEISKASLTASDISSATCKQSGDNYVITMTLKNGTSKASASSKSDTTALGRTGLYSGTGDKTAFDYKNAANIHAGINNADGASVETVTENNKNIKVTATVNSKTGNIVSLNVSYDWDVSMTNVKYVVTIKSAAGDAKTSVEFTGFSF